MGKFLLGAIALTLLIYAFFDLLASPREHVLRLPKPVWFVVILVPIIGPIAWLSLGHRRRPPSSPPPPPSRRGPIGPEDDWSWGR